jgi:Transposase DDE domain
MGYMVTAASCHDRITAEKAMFQLPHPYEFGDKGYASKLLQEKLMRVNMALPFELRFAGINVFCSEEWKQWMYRKRKIAETSFFNTSRSISFISLRWVQTALKNLKQRDNVNSGTIYT